MKIACWCHLDRDFVGNDEQVRSHLDRVVEAGIDILLPFVHSENEVWYQADLTDLKQEDRLTRLLILAKDRGLQVEPTVLPICDFGLSQEERNRRNYQSGQPGGNHCDGRFCASWAKTREGGLKIIQDIMAHHSVDGIHLDAIRYLDTGQSLQWPCRCEACRTQYQDLFGKDTLTAEDLKVPGILQKFLNFRGENIRGLVEQVARVVDKAGLSLSMAARADYFGSALVEGQDWVQWARDGLMDFICPMNYSTDREVHRKRLSGQMSLIGKSVPIYDGIGRKSSAGEIAPAQMIQQAEDALQLGASGVAIFHLAAMGDEDFRELGAFKRANM